MTPWMRMLLPVGFGVVAAIINFVVLKNMNQQTEFVCVKGKHALKQGELFTPAVVDKLKVSGDVKLTKAWIRWDDRETIFGRPAGRTLQVGELVLRQDTQPPRELKPLPNEDALVISLEDVQVESKLLLIGEEIGFAVEVSKPPPELPTDLSTVKPGKLKQYEPPADIEYLGPFRLLSVGDRLSRNVGENKKEARAGTNSVTIAVNKINGQSKLEDKVERLVRAATTKSSTGLKSCLLKLFLHRNLPQPDAASGESKAEGEEGTAAMTGDEEAKPVTGGETGGEGETTPPPVDPEN